jgi:hypothetical protein
VKKQSQNPIERVSAALGAARRALRAAGRRPGRTPASSDVEDLRAALVTELSDLAGLFAGLYTPGLPGVMGHEGERADRLWDLADGVLDLTASVRALAAVALCGDRSDRAFAAALLDAAGSLGEAVRATQEHLDEREGEW